MVVTGEHSHFCHGYVMHNSVGIGLGLRSSAQALHTSLHVFALQLENINQRHGYPWNAVASPTPKNWAIFGQKFPNLGKVCSYIHIQA